MRKNLLAAAVSSAALLFAAAAYADGSPIPEETPPPPPDEVTEPAEAPVYAPAEAEYNWYTTIMAGAAFGDSVDLDASIGGGGPPLFPTYNVPMNTGYMLGWTLGYDNVLGGSMIKLRPEVELSFRQQDVDLQQVLDDLFGPGNPAPDPLNLAVDMLTLMGNVWADIDFGGGFVPYAGGGIGMGWADFGIVESSDFVWQFGGGINFNVSPRVFLGIGYRYLGGNFDETIAPFGPPGLDVSFDYRAHEVMANMGVRF